MSTTIATSPAALAAGVATNQPLYKEVKQRLTSGLVAGQWKPGAAIPSETRLAELYDVSIGTVRKAIDELVAEKILVRHQGRGTFVATHTADRNLYYFFHIVGRDGVKENPDTTMLSFVEGRADSGEAARLAIAEGERVFRVRNLLRLSERPISVDDLVVAGSRFPDLDAETFGGRAGTIYGLYEERYATSVVRIAERLSADVADGQASRLLGVPEGTPLLRIARIAYTYNDTPVELRRSLVDTRHHEYFSDLVKT